MSRWSFQGKYNLWKSFIVFCSPLSGEKNSPMFWKLSIHRVQKKVPKNFSESVTVSFFSDFQKKFSGVSPKMYPQDCQNWFLVFRWSSWGKKVLLIEKKNSIFSVIFCSCYEGKVSMKTKQLKNSTKKYQKASNFIIIKFRFFYLYLFLGGKHNCLHAKSR